MMDHSVCPTGEDAPPTLLPLTSGLDVFPTLAGITDIIATKIPSLAGVATAIGSPTPSAPPPAVLSIDSMSKDISTHIPDLAEAVNAVAKPAAPVLNSTPSSPATVPAPSLSPHTNEENPYVTVLASWTSQEEADSESSNDENEAGVGPGLIQADGAKEVNTVTDPTGSTNRVSASPSQHFIPTRPAPPPPPKVIQSQKPAKQKTPRAATIRVSRKKGGSGSSAPQSAVVRTSWLDVWKGFRYSVLWVTLDGQLMSLWKKRTDRFSEVLFHVSSITNVKSQDRGRFSVYFRRKHYDFMAVNSEVQEGWVSSLQATRGQPSPKPPELHGQITLKEPRSRGYAAVWGHSLWIYPNKENFQLGLASFSIPLNVATVKSTRRNSFTLITPYKTFKYIPSLNVQVIGGCRLLLILLCSLPPNSLSVDSSKDLSMWLDSLSSTIHSALSCSQVALRLWENPYNKVCGDCGAANPEWASVNLLLVICQNCAGKLDATMADTYAFSQHRALGSKLSKVRSLRMDSKVWTEPLMQVSKPLRRILEDHCLHQQL
ncbi:unnamed protein product [Menidia menidia]|uniref:(Atlantic silverside) hypothetical protein n=1 Tax=Menidia menidia TaxID=238744 RepID=A0A8S4AJL3_9TELE|nr:unnamed protein product [Menidia menidia]CAG5882295.1 unnamed protein product [Menidia menidia]